jgi:hypothetical protein
VHPLSTEIPFPLTVVYVFLLHAPPHGKTP